MSRYNLQVLRGLSGNRSLLSCGPSGLVDLWVEDDASGRQRWDFQRVSGVAGSVYNITVAGGTDPGEKFLSCTADGTTVDLWDRDDGSGRQRWLVTEVAVDPEIPAYFTLQPVAGLSGARTLLSCTPDGITVDLWDRDDGSGRQRWQLQGPELLAPPLVPPVK